MNQQIYRNIFVVGIVAIGVIAGVAVGFVTAHRMMTGDQMQSDMKGIPREDTRPMKDMEPMPGMSGAPSGAIAIPAVVRQLIGVRSAPVTYASLGQEIRAVGTVGYNERGLTQVTVKTPGWVREVFVDSIGRPVRKGEPLFTFYSPDLLATQDEYLLALRTQGRLAASPLAEVKANAGSLVASSRERLHLWDVTDLQIAALESRGTAEPILTVYAPASGIVLRREAFPGKYVEPGTTLYEVANLSTVWVSADIYESEVETVTLNQSASVTFAAYPGTTFRGNVSYIYPSLNAETRTVRVRVELPNPGLTLKPGMYGNVTVQTDAVHTLVVPKEAVLETGLRQLVFMDRGQGRYEPASVKLGRRSQDFVEVLEGLKEGDRIVTSANFLLDAESKLASTSSMQAMMGRIGMADWQMRGAHESKMEDMPGMEMGSKNGMTVAETRQMDGLTLSLTTAPEKPKAGDVLLRLKVTDLAGKSVTNAQVVFVYTMPMPGMADSKATARHTKDGLYEGTVRFGMGGTWLVTVNLTVPGRPPVAEKFQFSVAGRGM
jgi:Cu(I)/Ag(I) efflux system membrane fusion protein